VESLVEILKLEVEQELHKLLDLFQLVVHLFLKEEELMVVQEQQQKEF
tara:strand:- start:366 stop:509 length:144 start_codon:yes stop_codon:yes gene_type:complete